nr:MAG TPA: hypothetical protein [Caudoviricetes sp.]
MHDLSKREDIPRCPRKVRRPKWRPCTDLPRQPFWSRCTTT